MMVGLATGSTMQLITPGAAKLVIELSVTQPPGHAAPWFEVSDRIVVPSPVVYLAPVELTNAELLVQALALPLLAHVVAEAKQRAAISAAWQPLVSALYLWQVWDMDLPLAAWRGEVVQWLYLELPGADPEQVVVLPEHYAALCAAHKLWMLNPAYWDITLLCDDNDREDRKQVWRGSWDSITRLDQLAVPTPQSLIRQPFLATYHPGQTVALATLIEYAVATYGRERLPALVAGLGRYDSWESLVPAVFGVSVAQFERGWQQYLSVHYGVSLDTFSP